MSCDPEHRFELALQLGELKIAYNLAKEAQVLLLSRRQRNSSVEKNECILYLVDKTKFYRSQAAFS